MYKLLRPLYKKTGDGVVRQFMRGIHTYCNVPLFCDWEEFYRKSDFETPIPVCWLESKMLFAKLQFLFLIEHALMMIPMIWLKLAVDKRHTILDEGPFKPIHDEVLSKQRVDLLIGLGCRLWICWNIISESNMSTMLGLVVQIERKVTAIEKMDASGHHAMPA